MYKKSISMLAVIGHLFCKFIYRHNSYFYHFNFVTMISVPLNTFYGYEQVLIENELQFTLGKFK